MASTTPPTTLRISKGLFTDKAPFEEDIYNNDCIHTGYKAPTRLLETRGFLELL
jgi:hypothetical protein